MASKKTQSLKSQLLKSLPKDFHCDMSNTGMTVQIWVDTNKVGGFVTANQLVYDLAKKLKLDEVGASTDLTTMIRDWEFIDTSSEKQMIAEAKAVYKTMKSFFTKYGNTYCSSSKCYDIIEKMRGLVETDEA